LEKRGFTVFVPAMPNTKHPKMNEWLEHLTKVVGNPDENCYFLGHSLGCITILRYIEALKENQKIGGAVLVAGFTSNLGYEDLESFFEKPIDWRKINSHCKKFVAIHSDNDPFVSLHYGEMFKEKLNAEVVIEHNMKHFSGGDGIEVLPVALESLAKISKI
jgi:predicted alpha/beta hydrolase family esterase